MGVVRPMRSHHTFGLAEGPVVPGPVTCQLEPQCPEDHPSGDLQETWPPGCESGTDNSAEAALTLVAAG